MTLQFIYWVEKRSPKTNSFLKYLPPIYLQTMNLDVDA